LEVDDKYLHKIRKAVKSEMEDSDIYSINIPYMVIGTFTTIIGWCMMGAAGTGTTHTLNSYTARY
jgi:hypothetical protein